MEPKFGAHMSMAGGLDRAVQAAARLDMISVQVFTKNNNQWAAKPLTEPYIAAFRDAMTTLGVGDAVAHNSYLINLGSPDDALWNRSIDAMTIEVERAEALGIPDLVCHPGAHVGSGEEAGLARIAQGIDEVHRRTKGVATRIALETTAGQGTCLGHRFEHLGRILELVAEPERLAICVDTCHVFAAGYSLESAADYNETMDALDRAVGLKRVRVWHLNDSLRERGSRVDRHAGIGLGKMGLEPFRRVVNDPRFASVPMIMETPKGTQDGEDLDARNLLALRQLLQRAPTAAAESPPRPRRDGRRMRR